MSKAVYPYLKSPALGIESKRRLGEKGRHETKGGPDRWEFPGEFETVCAERLVKQ